MTDPTTPRAQRPRTVPVVGWPLTLGIVLWLVGCTLFGIAAFDQVAWHGILLVPLGLLFFAASTRVP